jgi:hypothetical protein
MKCAKCGQELLEGANFCQHCGAPVKAAPQAAEGSSGAADVVVRQRIGKVEGGQVVGNMVSEEAAEKLKLQADQEVNEMGPGAAVAGNIVAGEAPVHVGGQQHYGDVVHGRKIDTGGGAYIESASTGGGDLVLGDKISGDYVRGDKVQGDKISIGDVSRSQVAIGQGAQAQGVDRALLTQLFEQVSQRIDQQPENPAIDKDELRDTAARVEKEVAKDDQANPERLKRWLDVLEKYAPDIVEIIVNALLNPGAGAASVVKSVLKQFDRRAAR